MIQSFSIENFKSFRKATLPLSPLTLLIGANASGKSNAIEAIQLLAWLASGRPLNDLLYDVREQELSLRGGFKDLGGADGEISLGCEATEDSDRTSLTFSISLEVTEAGLQVTTQHLFAHENMQDSGKRLLATASQDFKQDPSEPVAKFPQIASALSSMFFLDPNPRRMREYSFVQEKQLKRDGSALSSVLRRLTEEEGEKARVLDFIRFLPEQDISDISYVETPRGEVMVQLHETFGGRAVPRDAALLSDGTLRVLAVAAALLSIPKGSVVIVEEIDNGVHPSRAERLLADVQKIARERDLRVLLTTHNPALLDALPLEAIPDTVACYRDPEEGDSRLIRLEELESYPELVAQGPLGWLVTRGILDRYLKDPDKRDGEVKVEKGLAWLADFKRRVQSS
ncbi:MAG TPA: ATP-binding protein [Thermoanaerobaculia bacterium]|jgi:predicted ATPase|nr:ATP-binding protein [Thermoanaerobaculia bacterium]